jgi:sialate O-acetylesterase
LPDLLPKVATVPAIDLPLDDGIHIGSLGCARLGVRLAESMRLLRGDRKAKPPIALKGVVARSAPSGLGTELIVEFDHAVGKLRGPGRPLGFALLSGEQQTSAPYRVDVRGNKAVLYCSQPLSDLETLMLQYGLGLDPPCNITDDADRAVPVFGPIAIGKARALSSFAKQMLTTDLLPGAGKLRGLSCPNGTAKLKWRLTKDVGGFIDLHGVIGATAPDDRLVYFTKGFECVEPMKLAACLGYDGPAKMWIDRKLIFHDPEGTNPAWPDKAKRTVAVGRGRHDVMVALGTNRGKAWGIYLRLERMDITKKQLSASPANYAMPKWVD